MNYNFPLNMSRDRSGLFSKCCTNIFETYLENYSNTPFKSKWIKKKKKTVKTEIRKLVTKFQSRPSTDSGIYLIIMMQHNNYISKNPKSALFFSAKCNQYIKNRYSIKLVLLDTNKIILFRLLCNKITRKTLFGFEHL